MASNISSMLQFWKSFSLPQLQRDLDGNATELANRQDASDASRRRLVEQSKEFKKSTPEDVRKSVAPLLRSFQSEIDALSKRSKACEADFLNLYKKLVELPDPVVALEQAELFQRKAQRLNDVETENQKLRETLAEYNKEFAEVKNQEVTIKNLRDRVREFEKETESRAKQLTQEKSDQLEKQFADKERKLQETQLLIATKLGEAEQMAATFKAALDASQAELFDLKSKYDEETAAKQAELDILLSDVERSSQRAAIAEKECEELKVKMSENIVQTQERKKSSTAMEEAIEVLSRSSLEAELSNKEKEIGQLVEDVRHLQGSMGKLRESSAGAIAKLEEELGEKNALCQELQARINEREDYNEIKRELQIIKSTEFASLDSSSASDEKPDSSSTKAKTLEVLLLEKNRAQQSENTALRAANAQMTGREAGYGAASVGKYRKKFEGRRKSTPPSSPPRHHVDPGTSRRSPPPSLAATSDYQRIFHSSDTLTQLQLQKQQQINALLNLKILAGIKAAVAAQNLGAPPINAFTSPPSQNANLLYSHRYKSLSPGSTASSSHTRVRDTTNHESTALAKYLAHLQKLGSRECSAPPVRRQSDLYRRPDFSDNSDSENPYETEYLKRRRRSEVSDSSNISQWRDSAAASRLPSSFDSDQGLPSMVDRYRRFSSGVDPITVPEVDTEELTCQVKELLQANNIGQRAFGQYVLGLSQGSVSEILSKPKPWSKLTFKGKEPFYKMMDFISSSRNVDLLKSLQRRDREDRVICSGKPHALRQEQSDSDQAIANILAAAREEMRIEKEKLKRAQELYSSQKISLQPFGRSRSDDTSFGRGSTSQTREKASSKVHTQSPGSRQNMAMMAAGHCSYSHLAKENDTASIFDTDVMSGATDGAEELKQTTALPSLINRQQSLGITGNEGGKAVKRSKDTHDAEESSACHFIAANGTKENGNTVKKLKTTSAVSCTVEVRLRVKTATTVANAKQPIRQNDSVSSSESIVKTEPKDSAEGSNYFQAKSKVQNAFKAAHRQSLYKDNLKDDIISDNQRLISPHDNESLQRLFVTTTYNDPFIPPPLSPAGETAKSPVGSNGASRGSGGDEVQRYRSPFMGDGPVSPDFISGNTDRDEAIVASRIAKEKADLNILRIQNERKRIASLSPPSRHSSGLLSEPVLFKELSCPSFHVSDRESCVPSDVVSTGAPVTFSGMLSSNMSSIQTSSHTSVYDSQASYTELNPVTTGSLYESHREAHDGTDFHGSSNNGYATLEGSQQGISRMLPPLTLKPGNHTTTSMPTFSTLQSSVAASKFSPYHTEEQVKNDDSYESDQTLESSSLMASSLPPEALHKLSTSHVDTALLTKQVRDRLSKHGICQRIFGERILGLSQGTVSDILSHPKPWGKLTHKGREPFARMILWLADSNAGGLLPVPHEAQSNSGQCENLSSSPHSDISDPVNLTKEHNQVTMNKNNSPTSNGTPEGGTNYVSLSPPTSIHSPHTSVPSRSSPRDLRQRSMPAKESDHMVEFERQISTSSAPDHVGAGGPITPLQQMLNIQELAASCPKLDTFALTRKVKDLLTEHNIGQRIFGQAVLGLTQGSVSDLLSRPKLWRSLSLKGREPFVRMQLWLSDPNNIEQLKSLKLERWMEKKWGGKRQRSSDGVMQHNLSPVKKQRIVLSTEEKEVLRRAYAIEPYPSQETVDLLAIKLGRKSSTIVNWFHNYRSRVKRGFFPGEELQDASVKKNANGNKMTVKQLLDSITLSVPARSEPGNGRSYNSPRPFSSKNAHSNTSSANLRQSVRVAEPLTVVPSWAPPNVPSPPSYDRYNSMAQMKMETMDQHFESLQRSSSDDLYTTSMMHGIKEEKLMPELTESSAVYGSSYTYSGIPSSVPEIFKSAEMTLNDPVAMAAASSFIQPKPVQNTHYQAGTYYPPPHLEDHHESYSLPLGDQGTYKQSVSPSSPSNNSILPPVHTLTPKKSFNSPPSLSTHSTVLPSASSLLHPHLGHSAMDDHSRLPQDGRLAGLQSHHDQRMHHHMVSLNRPRYDAVVANNNMNNNAGTVKNVTLPGGVSLSLQAANPTSASHGKNHEMITATVWVGSPPRTDATISPKHIASTSDENNNLHHDEVTEAQEKENPDDGYAWVF